VSSGKLNLIFNLENVDLVDYSGLSVLVIAYKNIANHSGRLKLLHVPLAVVELLRMVRLDSVFEVYADEAAAVNSFFETEASRLHLRRKFQRLDIHLRARYNLAGSGKEIKTFEGEVLNISAAGVYIYTPHTFPLNAPVKLEFNLPHLSCALETEGKVVWLADRELQTHSYPGMGVAFVHLTGAKETSIIDFIEKNITHRAEP
jgi:Tfp pilus assembly protein PilZ